jgi:CRISPR-associated protein (TIGR03986 family)
MANKFHHQHAEGFEALTPYNFVPLPEAVFTPAEELPAQDCYHENRHTGYIKLDIKTETPLYVRCAYPPNVPIDEKTGKPDFAKQPECQNFFHRGNATVPVIPGSSLRGMVRALVEILSYGKLAFVGDKQLVHRAVGDTSTLGNQYRGLLLDELATKHFNYPSVRVRGGYLEKRGRDYFIRPAVEHRGESFIHVEYSDFEALIRSRGRQRTHDIYVEPSARRPTRNRGRARVSLDLAVSPRISRTPGVGLEKACLVESGHMGKPLGETARPHEKHMHCAMYEADADDAKLIPIPNEPPHKMWEIYEDDRDMTRGTRTPTRKLGRTGDPLFYLVDAAGNLYFFGPTMMFRLPYPNTLYDFLDKELRTGGLDLAEAVFGKVPLKDENSEIIAGRVFFTDAVWERTNDYPFLRRSTNDNGRRVPKILSTPKPTSFQLYLNQPETTTKYNQGDTVQDGNSLKSYYDKNETAVRGHKLYWHRKSLALSNAEGFEEEASYRFSTARGVELEKDRQWKPSTQHTVIRPVKRDTKFVSYVHFENLSSVELGALLAALRLEENQRHHLGMGKPLGLGTVKISAELYLQERKQRYESLFAMNGAWDKGEKEAAATAQAQEQCEKAFREAIIRHFNESVKPECKIAEDAPLSAIPRLDALFTILEWGLNGQPDPFERRKTYLGIDTKDLQKRWRERPVLPHPQVVNGKPAPKDCRPTEATSEIETTASPSNAHPVAPSETNNPSQKRTTLAGVVKFYKPGKDGKSFGYIVPDDKSPEVKFTQDAVAAGRRVVRGQRVKYTLLGEAEKSTAQSVE